MAKNRYVKGLLKPLGNFIGAQTNGQSDTIDKVMPVWQFYKVAQNIFVNYFSEITFYQQKQCFVVPILQLVAQLFDLKSNRPRKKKVYMFDVTKRLIEVCSRL